MSRLFGRRIDGLSPPPRLAALIAALDEPTEQDAFLRAARSVGATASAWAELEGAAIVRIHDGRVDFTHPLLRRASAAIRVPRYAPDGPPRTGLGHGGAR
jgi:hypothetical protein